MTVVVDIVELIQAAMPAMRESEQQAARVVLADLDFAVAASTTELSRRAGISPTTITRFCRALGFEGLRDFKLCVAQNLAVGSRFVGDAVRPADSLSELVRSVCRGLGAALADVEQEVSPSLLTAAVGLVGAAARLSVFPLDPQAGPVALDAQMRFLRLGLEASLHLQPDEQRLAAANAGPGCSFVLFGFEPPAADLVVLSEIFEMQGKPALLISPSTTPVVRFAGVHLPVRTPSPHDAFAQAATRYRLAILLDLVCAGLGLGPSEVEGGSDWNPLNQAPPPIKR